MFICLQRKLQKPSGMLQRLWHSYKSSPSADALVAYKKAIAIFKRSVKEAKRKAIGKFTLNINPSSPKNIWAKVKALTGIPSPPIKLIQLSNCSIFTAPKIAHDQPNHKNFILSQPYNPENISKDAASLEVDFSFVEFELALQHAKGKTPGKDRISYPMPRNLPRSSKDSLLSLYNRILNTGTYPHSWISPTILPIPKSNKPLENTNSYRPISLISCLSKTLEKRLTKRLMCYTSKNNLISHNEVAFKKKHGTFDALIPLQHRSQPKFLCPSSPLTLKKPSIAQELT